MSHLFIKTKSEFIEPRNCLQILLFEAFNHGDPSFKFQHCERVWYGHSFWYTHYKGDDWGYFVTSSYYFFKEEENWWLRSYSWAIIESCAWCQSFMIWLCNCVFGLHTTAKRECSQVCDPKKCKISVSESIHSAGCSYHGKNHAEYEEIGIHIPWLEEVPEISAI